MSDNQPTHYVYLVSAPTKEGGKKVWTRLAPLWIKDGNPDKSGFDIPHGLSINGGSRIVILEADQPTE